MLNFSLGPCASFKCVKAFVLITVIPWMTLRVEVDFPLLPELVTTKASVWETITPALCTAIWVVRIKIEISCCTSITPLSNHPRLKWTINKHYSSGIQGQKFLWVLSNGIYSTNMFAKHLVNIWPLLITSLNYFPKLLPYLTETLPSNTITDSFINSPCITQVTFLTQRVVVITFCALITLSTSVRWFTFTLARLCITG